MSDLEIQQRLMRPFVKRAMATANGNAAGTTIGALQLPALGEIGLGEADDFWNDAEVLILTGDMKDQVRQVTDWVQATGTLTVDHAFINPNVSLLSGNVAPAAVIIPVVSAALFSTGEARIWDALNAETVTITIVDTTLNQLTIAAPGLTNGYTVAFGAAISMSPRILGPVVGPPAVLGTMFLISTPTKTQDTGEHTNPRRYEKDYGFASAVVARAGGVTALWAAALAAVYPAAGRTDGTITTIYEFHIENPTGAAITAWLEVAGAAITPPYHVATLDTVVIDWPAGFTIGNVNVGLNASVDNVIGQIFGTQE